MQKHLFSSVSRRRLHLMENFKAITGQLIGCGMFSMRQIQTVAHSLVHSFVNILK